MPAKSGDRLCQSGREVVDMLRQEMLDEKVWAVIGVSDDRKKYGNKVYRRLKSLGYTVYAVNPGLNEVEGDPCYPDLRALPEKPAVINMVVSPRISLAILPEAAELGIRLVWFQPGSWDEAVGELCDRLNLTMLQDCVLMATINRMSAG